MKRTPLRRSRKPLRSVQGLQRCRRIRPVSDKQRRKQAERKRNMREAFGTEPLCAIRWDSRCRGWADSTHEIQKRSDLGSITDPANSVPACNPCNGAVEDFPAEAALRGWVRRSWEGDPAA